MCLFFISTRYPFFRFCYLCSLLILGAVPVGVGQGQSFTMDYYDNDDGLSQSTINCIIQDKLGYIWIGTQDGLNRFDGYSFTTYRHDPDDPYSLGDNFILGIDADAEGDLWIATRGGGVNKYELRTGRFHSFQHDEADPASLSSDRVRAVLVDNEGYVWAATIGGGLNRYNPGNGTFDRYSHSPTDPTTLLANDIYTLYKDKAGTVWAGSVRGVSRFNPATDNFTSFPLGYVRAILEDAQGGFWVGTYGQGLKQLNRTTGAVTVYRNQPGNLHSLSNDNLLALLEAEPGVLLVGIRGGYLNRFDTRQETFSLVETEHPNVRVLYNDDAGNTWIGLQVGLNKINSNRHKFTYYRNSKAIPDRLTNNNIYAVCKDSRGNIWAGSFHDGLSRIDNKTGEPEHYRAGDGKGLNGNLVRAIFEDSKGRLWVGTNSNGLYRYDYQTNRFRRVYLAKTRGFPEPQSINQIYEDAQGNLWFCTFDGLRKLLPDGRVDALTVQNSGLTTNATWSIYQDHRGNYWIGLYAMGFDVYQPASNTFTHYENKSGDPHSLANNGVSYVYEDSKHRIWVAIYGGGLDLLDPQTGKFKHYSRNKGLANPALYGILEDEQGLLWMSHNGGISSFDPETETFVNYSKKDGLFGEEFNSGAFTQTRAGEMLFGSREGVVSFSPGSFRANNYQPPVHITGFSLFNRPLNPVQGGPLDSLPEFDKRMALEHDEGYFSISFVALNYVNPAANRYKYKLEGFDKEWITAGSSRTARYTNVPPGEYVFRVQGANNDGIWNTTGDSLVLIVKTPWWETWWFRLALLAALLALLWTAYRLRVANIRHQRNLLAAQVQERTAEIASQSRQLVAQNKLLTELNQEKDDLIAIVAHDLRSPLNQIKGLIGIINTADKGLSAGTRENVDLIGKSMDRLRTMITRILDINVIESGQVNLQPETFDLNELLQGLCTNFTPLAVNKQVALVFKPAPEAVLLLQDKNYTIQVIENIISNAIKFTARGTAVYVKVRIRDQRAEIMVRDQGPGISAKDKKLLFSKYKKLAARPTAGEESTGIGLSIVKKYVTAMQGKVWCEDNPDKGITFIISFRLPEQPPAGEPSRSI